MEPPFIFLHCRYWSAVSEWCPLALRCNEKNSALMEHIGKWNTRSPLKNWTFKRKFQKMGLCVMWHVPIVFSLHWTKSRNSEYFMLPTGRNSAVLLLCLCLPSYQTLSWHHEIQERSQCKGSSRAPSWKFGHSLIHFSNQPTNQRAYQKLRIEHLLVSEFLLYHRDELMSQKDTIPIPIEQIV